MTTEDFDTSHHHVVGGVLISHLDWKSCVNQPNTNH